MNYQGKIIGLIVQLITEEPSKIQPIYIPCYPSMRIANIDIVFTDDDIWKDYETTRDILFEISKKSQSKVLRKPRMKVIDKGLIVGILTETNQFIQTVPPAENIYDDGLEEMKDTNYIFADKVLNTSKKQDPELTKTIRNIQLENQFYNAFRTTVRMAINDPENVLLRRDILKWVDATRTYHDKIKAIIVLLKKLLKKWVAFTTIKDDVLTSFDNITNCVRNANTKSFCLTRDNVKQGFLMIPSKHLISGVDNQTVYYGRIADEMVRYNRIRTLLIQPRIHLNVGEIDYNLRENEMILLDSLVTPEYFEDMVPFQFNKYASKIDFYQAQPEVSQKYKHDVSLDEQYNIEDSDDIRKQLMNECVKDTRDIIGNVSDNIWKRSFPKTAKEQVLHKSVLCGYFLLIQLFYIHPTYKGTVLSVDNIKSTLSKIYSEYLNKYKLQIYEILHAQGKHDIIKRVRTNRATLTDIIQSEEYYLTPLDIWLFASYTKLPIILFSSGFFKNMVSGINWLVLHKNVDPRSPYYFVRVPFAEVEKNIPPNYHLVVPPLKLSDLKGSFESNLENPEYKNHVISIDAFLQSYVPKA